jgi:hypothetical protein
VVRAAASEAPVPVDLRAVALRVVPLAADVRAAEAAADVVRAVLHSR